MKSGRQSDEPILTGDVYAVGGHRRDITWPFVVTKSDADEVVLAPLRWFGADAPPKDKLDALEALEHNSFHITDTWQYVTRAARLRDELYRIGHRDKPVDLPKNLGCYRSLSSVIRRCERQVLWEDIPATVRHRFKELLPQGSAVVGEGPNAIPKESVKAYIGDHLALVGNDSALVELIAANSLVTVLDLTRCALEVLDLSSSHVLELTLRGDQQKCVRVPSFIECITLHGPFEHPPRIEHARQGAGMQLVLDHLPTPHVPNLELPRLMALKLSATDVDLSSIPSSYPQLEQLELFGAPGRLHGIDVLGRLANLRSLFIRDLFGYDATVFPSPDQLPHLGELTLVSVPADVGTRVRKSYRHVQNLDVAQLRSPEWLATNVANPFRAWDGRANIKPVVAKGAFRAYVKVRKELAKVESSFTGAEPFLIDFIVQMNKLGAKSNLETMERDEIARTLMELAESFDLPSRKVMDLWERLEDL